MKYTLSPIILYNRTTQQCLNAEGIKQANMKTVVDMLLFMGNICNPASCMALMDCLPGQFQEKSSPGCLPGHFTRLFTRQLLREMSGIKIPDTDSIITINRTFFVTPFCVHLIILQYISWLRGKKINAM